MLVLLDPSDLQRYRNDEVVLSRALIVQQQDLQTSLLDSGPDSNLLLVFAYYPHPKIMLLSDSIEFMEQFTNCMVNKGPWPLLEMVENSEHIFKIK